jgi:hypothetical protein
MRAKLKNGEIVFNNGGNIFVKVDSRDWNTDITIFDTSSSKNTMYLSVEETLDMIETLQLAVKDIEAGELRIAKERAQRGLSW